MILKASVVMRSALFFVVSLSIQAFCSDLHSAVEQQNYCAIVCHGRDRALIKESDDDGNTALHIAAELGNIRAARILLYYGASVDAVNSAGLYPLHLASLNGNPAIVSLLVESGADINQRTGDRNWDTPLHLARDTYTWNMLVHLGADTQKMNSNNEPPERPLDIESPEAGADLGG